MFAIGQIYKLKQPINFNQQIYLDQAYAFYPTIDPVGIRWTNSNLTNNTDLQNFLNFANITNTSDNFYRRNP